MHGGHIYDTRKTLKFIVPRPRSSHFMFTMHYLGPTFLNSLPPELQKGLVETSRNVTKVNSLFRRVRKFLWSLAEAKELS